MTGFSIPGKYRSFGLLALAAAMCVSPVAGAEDYTLGVQDRVRVYVSEWPALSGEVTVGAGGQVSLPVVGEIPAKGLTTGELAGAIASRLKDKANLPGLVDTSVDIVAYRPFYILGSVTSPGEYSYRPGMLVLNAMSLAGGVYRSDRGSEWEIERVSISSRGEIAVLAGRSQDLRAEKVRLEAELEGAAQFPPIGAEGDPRAVRALEEQRAIFDASLKRHLAERASLEASAGMREKEIVSFAKQSVDVARKLETTRMELDQVRELAKRDLAVNKLFPLERIFADIQREQQELEISKLRAEQELNGIRRAMTDLEAGRRNGALTGIQRVNAQLREVEEQHRALLRLLDGAAYYSSMLVDGTAAEETQQMRYSIVRTDTDGKITEIEATETSRVEPGDIVKVIRVLEPMTTGALPGGGSDETR